MLPSLSFTDARAVVLRELRAGAPAPAVETAELPACTGRILSEDIHADRDYPPFHRSMRDGFAIRAADIPGKLRRIGEVRAGQTSSAVVNSGEALEIMTGAPLPRAPIPS